MIVFCFALNLPARGTVSQRPVKRPESRGSSFSSFVRNGDREDFHASPPVSFRRPALQASKGRRPRSHLVRIPSNDFHNKILPPRSFLDHWAAGKIKGWMITRLPHGAPKIGKRFQRTVAPCASSYPC